MISFEDVSFTYTNESYVLEDLSVEIPQGQFVCVLGANGSGKSTFSKLINALLLPDKGEVKVEWAHHLRCTKYICYPLESRLGIPEPR